MRALGASDPETMASLSDDQSCESNRPALRQAARCAGPHQSAVGRSRSTVLASSSGLKALRRTVQAPTDHAQWSEYSPYRCESGAAHSTRDCAVRPCSCAPMRLLPSSVRNGCGTALGEAVVPDV